MIEGRLSRRYARALFELASEAGRPEEIGRDLDRFAAAYAASSLPEVLNNPAFSLASRKNVVAGVARGLELSPLTIHFLSLLMDRDRLVFLAAIASCYRRLLDAKTGRLQARVVSPDPLDAGAVDKLRQALGRVTGKEVVLRQETDPALIGGLMVELEGKLYDGTVRTQIDKMKERIERGY